MPATILLAFSPEPARRSALLPGLGPAGGCCSSRSFGLVLAGQGGHENQNSDPNHGDDSSNGSRRREHERRHHWLQASRPGVARSYATNPATIRRFYETSRLQRSRPIFSVCFCYNRWVGLSTEESSSGSTEL